jgi:hypothetical protein
MGHTPAVLDIYSEFENEALTLISDPAMGVLLDLANSLNGELSGVNPDREESRLLVKAGFVISKRHSLALTDRGKYFLSTLGIKLAPTIAALDLRTLLMDRTPDEILPDEIERAELERRAENTKTSGKTGTDRK